MCDLSVAVGYIYAWIYDCGSSKHKHIVQALLLIRSVDVLVTKKQLAFAVVSFIDCHC